MDRPVRVRFAPSPTGNLHVGGARTALFNWAFARRHGGAFILRIEDTDTERNTPEALESILGSMRWLGLDWDEGPDAGGDHGPYFQSERRASYDQAAACGLEEGWLYRCFCTPERVAELKDAQRESKQPPRYDQRCRAIDPAESTRRAEAGEDSVLRFAVPEGETVVIQDAVRGDVEIATAEIEDWVAVRTGGMPTYNFCCALDDAAMDISHVLRGEEHLVNTPKQVLVAQALGLPIPGFAHLPLILGQDGKKLSKRTGETAVEDYVASGHPPEALFNFLCLLGFSLDGTTEIFTPEQMCEAFDLGRLQKAGALFDTDKLRWLCGEYIRASDLGDLTDRCLPWLEASGIADSDTPRERLEQVVAGEQERIRLYGELPERVAYLFSRPENDDKASAALDADGAGVGLDALAEALENCGEFSPSDFGALAKGVAESLEVGMGKILKPARAALTGTLGGPELAEIVGLLGREESVARLRAGVPA